MLQGGHTHGIANDFVEDCWQAKHKKKEVNKEAEGAEK